MFGLQDMQMCVIVMITAVGLPKEIQWLNQPSQNYMTHISRC